METLITRAVAPWFGANRLLAEHVGEELAGNRWVGVPFAGGMSELATIDASVMMVNDLHLHVMNLAMCIAHKRMISELIHFLARLPFHEEILRLAQTSCRQWEAESRDYCITMMPCLAWAQDYFTAVWMGRSSKAGTVDEFNGKSAKRWNANGGGSNVRYRSAVRSLVAWHHIMQRCEFSVMDAFDFLARCEDAPGRAVYCDPPFPGPGEKYKYTFTDDQHRRLAEALAGFESARVICRFYDVPLVRELYPERLGWTWRRLTGRKQTNEEAPEVLIINGPSYARSDAGRLFQ